MGAGMLEGKTVIIAGVGPGLGRETALVLAREGANVVLGAAQCRHARRGRHRRGRDRRQSRPQAHGYRQPGGPAALIAAAVDTFGGLDALVVIKHLASTAGDGLLRDGRHVAEVIGFFASPRAKGVTGQSIMVNAGAFVSRFDLGCRILAEWSEGHTARPVVTRMCSTVD